MPLNTMLYVTHHGHIFSPSYDDDEDDDDDDDHDADDDAWSYSLQ